MTMLERLKPKYPELLEKLGSRLYGGIDCGSGWEPIIDQLLSDLMAAAKEYNDTPPRVNQIKEKFGELRVYLEEYNYDKYYELVSAAGHLSGQTCEDCGAPGTIQNCNGWLRAQCGDHECIVHPRNKR